MNVAGVDIGTNSVRLLITDERGSELERHMRITRLGQGVDVTGRLHELAIARTLEALEEFGALIQKHGVTRLRAAATSAARDAANADKFFDAAEKALGARPALCSGEEEALLSFRGATTGLDAREGPFLVIDIGGGSTEFVLGQTGPEALISVDMGCVRMTERHLHSDPPGADELAALDEDVREVLVDVKAAIPVERARKVVGLAGTITALACLAQGLKRYDPSKTHHSTLTRAQAEQLTAQLAAAPVEKRRTMLAEPKRAEVIVGGAAVLVAVMRELDLAELMVSESDILDGLAASLLA
jgi:exopolyphosphatase/guanosine-5'-triphosphate,3'-diphosphate pyrophosphatase